MGGGRFKGSIDKTRVGKERAKKEEGQVEKWCVPNGRNHVEKIGWRPNDNSRIVQYTCFIFNFLGSEASHDCQLIR